MSDETRPSGDFEKLTQSSTPLTRVPRTICCGTPGTFTGVNAAGKVYTDFPLQQGYNPIAVLIWSGGTASDVWALY